MEAFLKQIIRDAGQMSAEYFQKGVTFTVKSNLSDLVTEADVAVNSFLIEKIQERYPDHKITSEEEDEKGPGDADYEWIIDPIDGTANFIHGIPHFAISIAAREKGKLAVGLIYDPIRREMFTAAKGEGAKLNDRKIRISQQKTLEGAIIGTGFPFKKHSVLPEYLKQFESIFTQTAGIRRAGAASLDLAYVAAGRLDGFWELDLKPWDIAAGALLIREAGGMITDQHGTDDYLKSGSVVAGNVKMLKVLLETIAKANAKE